MGVRHAVVAGGMRSVLRGQLFPRHPGLRHAGEAGWRAVLPGAGLPPQQATETWGRGGRFGVVPLVDGRIYVYATTVTGPGAQPTGHHAELTRRFGAWHDPIPALLDRLNRLNADPVGVLHHDFHELGSPPPRFHSGRVALLGDAAHAMTPNMGQGGCQGSRARSSWRTSSHATPTYQSRSPPAPRPDTGEPPLSAAAPDTQVNSPGSPTPLPRPSGTSPYAPRRGWSRSRALDTVLGRQPPSGPASTSVNVNAHVKEQP